ncbi:ABC transporter ATP-binding protein [Egibacter rhizosphaerae]|uniref:ABC transporter ATP-binding protein n=1 Tax=Egibacter rhizosphaerae TaxID=1670831 RepID=A0A411YLJ0_9ACTN|nr:ABC transporter ATP-binding protein [Egibacter rhizosphaerae]QBI22065.1 ABC transporter ATP-binding protein [Egibacter rhizosphaerae]
MTASPILSCRDVTKTFGGLTAVDGVDLDLYEGEIRGLVGPNGSGKSTLINVLTGFLSLDSGSVTVDGTRVERLPAHRVSELGVARTYQIPRPFATLSVIENVQAASYFGNAKQRPTDVREEAARWVAFAGMQDLAHEAPDALTLHQRKLLELTRALATRPRVLFLDEVLTGLNQQELAEGIALVKRIKEVGISIIVVEHIMRVILDLCDHLTVLNFGKVIARGAPRECLEDEDVIAAYLGKSHA